MFTFLFALQGLWMPSHACEQTGVLYTANVAGLERAQMPRALSRFSASTGQGLRFLSRNKGRNACQKSL